MSAGRCGVSLLVLLISFSPLIIGCLLSFRLAQGDRRKIDTYVKTNCRVTNSSLEPCDFLRSKKFNCFWPTWRIEYVNYRYNKQATITYSGFSEKTKITEQLLKNKLREYRIGQIYPCYHSPTNRLKEVQWEPPNVTRYTFLMILACGFLILFIGFTSYSIYALIRKDRSSRVTRLNLIDFNDSSTQVVHRRNLPSVPHVLTAAHREEEHVVLNLQPPAYSLITSLEGENIPLTPPPPYVTPGISVKNENILLTPPPAYVISPV